VKNSFVIGNTRVLNYAFNGPPWLVLICKQGRKDKADDFMIAVNTSEMGCIRYAQGLCVSMPLTYSITSIARFLLRLYVYT